jgi:hypothetical protein
MPVPPANRHGSLFVEPVLDLMRAIKRGGRGHPGRRPVKLHGDKDYDNSRVRRSLGRRGITARITRHGAHPGRQRGWHRGVIERILGWLPSYRRLALRYDRTAATITALDRLAITLICAHRPPTEVFSTDWPLGAGQDKCGRDDGADSLRTQPNTV